MRVRESGGERERERGGERVVEREGERVRERVPISNQGEEYGSTKSEGKDVYKISQYTLHG